MQILKSRKHKLRKVSRGSKSAIWQMGDLNSELSKAFVISKSGLFSGRCQLPRTSSLLDYTQYFSYWGDRIQEKLEFSCPLLFVKASFVQMIRVVRELKRVTSLTMSSRIKTLTCSPSKYIPRVLNLICGVNMCSEQNKMKPITIKPLFSRNDNGKWNFLSTCCGSVTVLEVSLILAHYVRQVQLIFPFYSNRKPRHLDDKLFHATNKQQNWDINPSNMDAQCILLVTITYVIGLIDYMADKAQTPQALKQS